jgi:SAM-dependent methyltransferase
VRDINELQEQWDKAGRIDPLYVILSDSSKKGRGWDLDGFFASGRGEIAHILEEAVRLSVNLRSSRALDFGCGVGRLTQALAEHFAQADGVDIAPSMVEQARTFNRHGEHCRYHLNKSPDLSLFAEDTFDLVYSNLVLQHMKPELSSRYITEFVRVLAPAGLVVFQVPSEHIPGAAEAADTVPTGPLPNTGFRAGISVQPESVTGGPDTEVVLHVTVVNEGTSRWCGGGLPDGRFRIKLGNHWRAATGEMLLPDDMRVNLPGDVPPGQAAQVTMPVTLPWRPGRYQLEVDLVQESVSWFADRGSPLAVVPVAVVAGSDVATTSDEVREELVWHPPCLEMNAIPRPEVEAILEAAGAEVIAVVANEDAGPDWVAYRYFASKPRAEVPPPLLTTPAEGALRSRILAVLIRWVRRAERRSPKVERALLAVALVMFAGGSVFAYLGLPTFTPHRIWPLLVAAAAGVSLMTLAVNGAEFAVSAKILGTRSTATEAFRVSVLGSAANLFPLPAAVLVRTHALHQKGHGYRRAFAATVAVGVSWVSMAFVLAGLTLLRREPLHGAVLAAVGLAGLVLALLVLGSGCSRAEAFRALRLIALVEVGSIGCTALRLFVVLQVLGVRPMWAQAFTLALVAVVAGAVNIFPAGIGLREALSAATAGLIGLPVSVGFLAAALDRMVLTTVLAAATGILITVGGGVETEVGSSLPGDRRSDVSSTEENP